MSSPLSQAGAVGTPSKFAPLHTNRFFTGLWTQRNPLRDAATPFLYEKFYSGSRFDSIIDGLNVEITPRLTLARRCGHSVYNSQTFTAINRFYEFRTFSTSAEIIHVMADCISNVYDATGPNLKKNILTKTAGAGSTYFQSVGNMLFMGNGVDQKKWVQTTKQWQDFFAFNPFDVIVDSNNNLQVATGARSANIISVSITGNVVTLTFDKKVALLFYAGMVLTISGLTGATFLNGSTITLSSVSYNQVRGAFVHANYGPTSDLGTAATLRGVTAGFEPVWATNAGDITPDGSEQWLCKGSSVQNWGISAPTVAPTAVNAIKPSPYNTWAANTVYSNSLSLVDGGGFVQRLTTGGITGGAMPAFNPVVGGTTADGTCVWTNEGAAAWAAGTTFATGALIEVTGSYEVTVPCFSGNTKVRTNEGPKEFAKSGVTEIIETEFGLRPAKLLVHEFDGEMIDMGGGELVTLDHMIKRDGKYIRAEKAFADKPRVHHVGPVFNYSVFTDNPDERHYILENGEVAHNSKDPDSGYTYTQTFTAVFECTFGGVSGGSEPAWIDGYGAIVSDGGITWQNIGNGLDWAATIGAATAVSLDQIIIDANGYKQQIQNSGKSGGAAPTWSETLSATTVDNLASWINIGVFSKANTGSQKYAFAPKNSITGEVATASPESAAFTLAGDSVGTIQGPGAVTTLPTLAGTIVTHQVGTAGPAALLANGDWFFIVYGVTSNGNEQPVGREATQNFTGFGLLKAMRVSGPALPADIVKWRVYYGRTAGGENQYAETVDLVSGLDISQPGTPGTPQGAVDPQCDVIQIYRTVQGGSTLLLLDEIPAPPLGQLWTYTDASTDADLSTTTQAQIALSNAPPPAGIIALTYHLKRVWGAVSNTLYFSAGPDTLNGNGNSCFPPANNFVFPSQITRLWATSIGLLVFTVSDVYIVQGQGTSSSIFYANSFLEGIGLLNYDAFAVNGSTAHLLTSAKKQISLDPGAGLVEEGFPIGDQFDTHFDAHTAFVTWHESASGDTAMFVSDGTEGWFRMAPTSAPETGAIWSPRATVGTTCKAVQSLEVTPGTVKLLIGPGATSGPILFRDRSVFADNTTPFDCFATIGSITLAQPGQLAELVFFTLDALKIGSRATVGVRLDEIGGAFSNNFRSRQDPPLLPPSNTLYNDRYYMAQNQQATFCRHFQVKFSWPAEDAANELLCFTIFGGLHQEKRQ